VITRKEAMEFLAKNSKMDKRGIVRYFPKIIRAAPEYQEILKLVDKIPNKEKITLGELNFCLEKEYNQVPICETCGKEIPFKVEHSNKKIGWYIQRYCNLKCFNNDPKVKAEASKREKALAGKRLEKRKKTIEENYGSWENRPGADNFQKSNERLQTDEAFRETRTKKTRKTNLERYGVEYTNQLPREGKRRRKVADETCLKRYSVKNPGSLESTIEGNLLLSYAEKRFNHIKLSKEYIEENFLDEKNHIKRKDLCEFLGCADTTMYMILEKYGVNYTKKNSGGVGSFDPNAPTKVYYIKDKITGFYKIGITIQTVKERLGPEYKNFIILAVWQFDNGREAFYTEQEILQEYDEFRVSNERFVAMGGKTEFFMEDVLELDIESEEL